MSDSGIARLGLISLLLSGPALAHIKLNAPPDWLVTNGLGDPQKTGPCGNTGTETGAVTTVVAGSTLSVQWAETFFHTGHFRIAVSTDRAQLVTPTAVVTGNNCVSAPIESAPAYPVLMDGLFPNHTNATVNFTQAITVPSLSCNPTCTLQLIQFMSNHTPPCFYFHCANLRIVAPDGGAIGTGGGAGGGSGGGGGTGGGVGGSGGGGSATGGGAGGGSGGSGGGSGVGGSGGGASATGGGGGADLGAGCGCGAAAAGGWLAAGVLLAALSRRRGAGRRER